MGPLAASASPLVRQGAVASTRTSPYRRGGRREPPGDKRRMISRLVRRCAGEITYTARRCSASRSGGEGSVRVASAPASCAPVCQFVRCYMAFAPAGSAPTGSDRPAAPRRPHRPGAPRSLHAELRDQLSFPVGRSRSRAAAHPRLRLARLGIWTTAGHGLNRSAAAISARRCSAGTRWNRYRRGSTRSTLGADVTSALAAGGVLRLRPALRSGRARSPRAGVASEGGQRLTEHWVAREGDDPGPCSAAISSQARRIS